MTPVIVSKESKAQLQLWKGWFVAKDGNRKHPPSHNMLIDALLGHFESYHGELGLVEKVAAQEERRFYGDKVKITEDLADRLKSVAEMLQLPQASSHRALDRLLKYYSLPSNAVLLRDCLRQKVVERYKDEADLIAVDLRLSLLPQKYVSDNRIAEDVLEQAVQKMVDELRKEADPTLVTAILAQTKDELLSNMEAVDDFQFVVFHVDSDFKAFLRKAVVEDMKFSSHLAAYLVKTICSMTEDEPEAPVVVGKQPAGSPAWQGTVVPVQQKRGKKG